MFRSILSFITKIFFHIELAIASETKRINVYKRYLGVKAGKNSRITGKITFGSEPYLIELGDNVRIARNVTFHTHEGATSIFRDEYPGINIFRKVKVGNNVMFGSNAVIMAGVKIGNNVVIGANSVVTKDCDSDSVYGGVPAKKITSLEDYKEKVLKEAIFIKSTDPKKRKQEILEHFEKLND